MARTRTPGIRVDRDGRRIIDKDHRGVAIHLRLAPISQEHAEQRLADEIARVNAELKRNANLRPRFADCAARYLAESSNKRSVNVTAWHVRLLTSYVGTLEVHQVHDGTLERFVAELPQALRPRPSIVVLRSCASSSTGLHAPIVTMPGARCWRPYLR